MTLRRFVRLMDTVADAMLAVVYYFSALVLMPLMLFLVSATIAGVLLHSCYIVVCR